MKEILTVQLHHSTWFVHPLNGQEVDRSARDQHHDHARPHRPWPGCHGNDKEQHHTQQIQSVYNHRHLGKINVYDHRYLGENKSV